MSRQLLVIFIGAVLSAAVALRLEPSRGSSVQSSSQHPPEYEDEWGRLIPTSEQGEFHSNRAPHGTFRETRKINVATACLMATDEPASLCPQGADHWSKQELNESLPDFALVYRRRPLRLNPGGVNVNHAFALWFAVNRTKPSYIIESGVHRGQTTFILREAAGPHAKIFALDPASEENLYFRDSTTQYFMGENFKDLSEMDWATLIPKEDRSKTFVVLDDHSASVKRVQQLLSLGFRHLWHGDNWKNAKDGNAYSFHQVCAPLRKKNQESLLYKDDSGRVKRQLSVEEHQKNLEFLNNHVEVYFEFPAIFDGCKTYREPLTPLGYRIPTPLVNMVHGNRMTILTSEADLLANGLPVVWEDQNKYFSLSPPYVKLRDSVI